MPSKRQEFIENKKMNFPSIKDELALLSDLASHYQSQAEAIMHKPFVRKNEFEKYQAISALADSAKELACLIREEQNRKQ